MINFGAGKDLVRVGRSLLLALRGDLVSWRMTRVLYDPGTSIVMVCQYVYNWKPRMFVLFWCLRSSSGCKVLG